MLDVEPIGGHGGPEADAWQRRTRIAVVLEPGRSGEAALTQAAGIAATTQAEVTVVAVAPKSTSCPCCGGPSPYRYDCVVRDDVVEELRKASDRLASATPRVEAQLLVEGSDPPLEQWLVCGRFDLVLLPARRGVRRTPSHPAAARLRRFDHADVRVVRARSLSVLQIGARGRQ